MLLHIHSLLLINLLHVQAAVLGLQGNDIHQINRSEESVFAAPGDQVDHRISSSALRQRDFDTPPQDSSLGTIYVDVEDQVGAYNAGIVLSGEDIHTDNVTAAAIRLVNFNGCTRDQKNLIYSGWAQAQKTMDIPDIKAGDVDFNSAAALEYLGPSGLNKIKQPNMNSIFKNFATLKPATWPFGWRLHVRCDDPSFRCSCGESEIAYTVNQDFESRLARINFCPRYFNADVLKPLSQLIKTARELPDEEKYDMRRYWYSHGHIWTHELMHVDWVSGASNSRNDIVHVHDLKLVYKTTAASKERTVTAYQPLFSKILARWPYATGNYTIRNADNLALFMTSQYVQSQLDNTYPHYPICTIKQPEEAPFVWNTVLVFDDQGKPLLNETNPLVAGLLNEPNCASTAQDGPDEPALEVSSFAPDSAYPSSFIAAGNAWDYRGSGQGAQIMAIASYTNPLGDPAAWTRLISYDTNKLSVLVANVLNGPDYKVNDAWADVIKRAAASGKTIIGYVRTGYLGVSLQNFKTRLGSSNLADWASQIEQDVDKWYELYPQIGGIFFDEGWPECGTNNIYADLYAYINAYTKRKHPGAFTVLNPGSPMAQCFENTMDTLLTFESFYDYYKNNYVPNDWTPKDARKIWHIIYNVPQDKVAEVADLARSRGAGLLEISDDTTPNPYDNVPADSYMQVAMAGVSGGAIRNDRAKDAGGSYRPGMPYDPSVIALDYTSATITWSPVAEALGYGVYKDDILVLELPASMNRATIGMLTPGTSGIKLEVRTLVSSDSIGTPRWWTITTKSLPEDGSISNVQWTQDGNMVTYTADVLVPFAFVRLFIESPHSPDSSSPGWPIFSYSGSDGFFTYPHYKLVNYLVEGNDFYSALYKYTGVYHEGSGSNADWVWTPMDVAPQSQSGYKYTWKVPLGGTDANPNAYVIQGQGYAPLQNRANGNTRSSDCRGHGSYCYDY